MGFFRSSSSASTRGIDMEPTERLPTYTVPADCQDDHNPTVQPLLLFCSSYLRASIHATESPK